MKDFAKRFKVTSVIVSQFSRAGHKEDADETPPAPTLESLRDSGEIEQNADKVLLLYKTPGKPTHLYTHENKVWDIDGKLAKNRTGPTGVIPLCLHTTTQRFMGREAGDSLRREIQ